MFGNRNVRSRNVDPTECDIHIKVDGKKERQIVTIDGDTIGIMMGIANLVRILKDNGMSKKLIIGAVEVGFENEDIDGKELEFEDKKEFNKFLKELGVYDNGSK